LEGDEIASEIYQNAGMYLGVAAAILCASVSPKRIIVAGGVANAGRLLLEPMEATMRKRVSIMPVEQVQIVPAALGEQAGVIGSALWAKTIVESS